MILASASVTVLKCTVHLTVGTKWQFNVVAIEMPIATCTMLHLGPLTVTLTLKKKKF